MRDRLTRHFAERLECTCVNNGKMAVFTFPFLDWYNDCITIDIVNKGKTYLVISGNMWGDLTEHEWRINAFLKLFNLSEGYAESPIRYTMRDRFHAESNYENLTRVIMGMLSCLVKFVGFVEVEMAMKGEE